MAFCPAVEHTVDFARIEALPRRTLTQADADRWASILTEELRVPGARVSLLPWQAMSLFEILSAGGGFLALPVGSGKTLIGPLGAVLCGAKRAVQFVPASLRTKTWADFGSYYGKWKLPHGGMQVASYQSLVGERGRNYLEAWQPDYIDLDEADEIANYHTAACRVLDRYIRARRAANKPLIVVAKTGTPARKSILGYWHHLVWALDRGAPVPLNRAEAETWGAAIDEIGDALGRPPPGPLGATLAEARANYLRRLYETPGAVIVDGDPCSAPITISVTPAREDATLNAAFESFLTDMVNPGGIPVTDPLSRYLLDGQLGCGLYSYWDPPPPAAWVHARRESAKFAREKIIDSTRSNQPLDTEGQVFRAYRGHPTVEDWLAIRDTFRETTKVKWLAESTIDSVRDWVTAERAPGIVWCGSVEFGQLCATRLRLPYYGRLGACESDPGRPGLHAIKGDETIVASWQANKKGFNLQAYGRMLVVMPPSSAKWLEQLFGRAHRFGRTDEVRITILATSGATYDLLDTARREAQYARETTGLTQKLLRADIQLTRPKVTPANEFRWARKGSNG